jgi:pimeloyl-ACP methyl ester carboxylesterase
MKRIFLHGLEGSSRGLKATLLRGIFPDIIIPDFEGSLDERMGRLAPILGDEPEWMIVGSSFGGLMAALWACSNPGRVKKLVLLAPALLHHPDFERAAEQPVAVPTWLFHGTRDEVVPMEPALQLARRVFSALEVHVVDDDHALWATCNTIDWPALLSLEAR